MAWIDLFAVALLAGIGFTVSLLIGELSFGVSPKHSLNISAVL
jgi:NhaA family Na+:H+ antiporter